MLLYLRSLARFLPFVVWSFLFCAFSFHFNANLIFSLLEMLHFNISIAKFFLGRERNTGAVAMSSFCSSKNVCMWSSKKHIRLL